MKDNKNRDFVYLARINEHAEKAVRYFKSIDVSNFIEDTNDRAAILFNLFQVGELVSKLSYELQQSVEKEDFKGIIDIRNHIVHGYDSLKNDIIIKCLNDELLPFVERLSKNALRIYRHNIMEMSNRKAFVYTEDNNALVDGILFGYVKELTMPNKQFQKVAIVDVYNPFFKAECTFLFAIVNKSSNEYILVGVLSNSKMNKNQIFDLIKTKKSLEGFELIQ